MAVTLPEIERFYFDYAACLDEKRYAEWPSFFADECSYEILSRENVEQNLPAPLMSCYSHGMVSDRVTMLVQKTLTVQSTYQKRFVSNVRIRESANDIVQSTANLLVMQSDLEGVSSIYMVGTYEDELTAAGNQLLIVNRRVIVDSFGIENMLAVPL